MIKNLKIINLNAEFKETPQIVKKNEKDIKEFSLLLLAGIIINLVLFFVPFAYMVSNDATTLELFFKEKNR